VIYTSGSTGRPKGVAIEHRSAGVLIEWASQTFRREDWEGVLAGASISFDLSVFELFGTLAMGGRVYLADTVLELARLPRRNAVRLVNTVPSAMAELLRSGSIPASVRVVNLAGEALGDALVQGLYGLGHVERVYDLYGPTEDTTYSTWALRSKGAGSV